MKKDHFGDIGCCLTCNNQVKEELQKRAQITYETYVGDKYYSCLCKEGKCGRCEYLVQGECQRKVYGGDNFCQ